MNLEFIKEGNIWVAEFEATSDFNLHIERVDDGLLKVMQRGTTEGEYVDTDVWDAGKPCYKNFDCDVAAFVYPKWIKVISGTEVITASVNFNEGGGSGSGSGSGSSDGITMEYYRIDWDKANDIIARFDYGPIYRSTLANAKTDYDCYIIGQTSLIAAGEFSREKIIKIGCISDNKEIVKDISTGDMYVYEGSTWLDFIKNRYTDVTDWSWLIPITEEEFYTMNDDEYPDDMPID